jgi:hypothetical protein
MPDSNGKFSADEKVDIQIKVNDLWRGGGKNCPICGSNDWILGDHIVESPIINQGVRGFGAGAYPSVMLISRPCGYTIFFNAVILAGCGKRFWRESVRNIDSNLGSIAHEGFNRTPPWILMLRIVNISLRFSAAC